MSTTNDARRVPWNKGEDEMHRLLNVPYRENPSIPFLTPIRANLLVDCPLLAIGTLDSKGRPWSTLLGGEVGFARTVSESAIRIKALVDREFDPVVEALLRTEAGGEPAKVDWMEHMVSGLAIDLGNRRRVKLYGRLIAWTLAGTTEGVGEAQIVVRIEESLGNCPKYLNKKRIEPRVPCPKLISDTLPLCNQAIDLMTKSDSFFISSSNSETDMDTNFRGGPPGFVRILENSEQRVVFVYPEYSGNRLYQTLGNLKITPQAGLVFPDFETGDVLYLTGQTEILVGADANALLPRSNLAVKIQILGARYVAKGLAFRGEAGEPSPYNPPVRYLSSERPDLAASQKETELKLIDRQILTPTIARFRFRLADDSSQELNWKPGQYVMISLEKELSKGYSHMRDDDPTSLNDDFIRTFTVSNRPQAAKTSEFEITIRNVGTVTSKLFGHNLGSHLDVSLKAFGGSFFFQQSPHERIAFVAGGIGITPLLAQAQNLDLANFTLFWSITYDDIGLVTDTFERIPGLSSSTRLFITGKPSGSGSHDTDSEELVMLKQTDAAVEKRRLNATDLRKDGDHVSRWYLCAGDQLRANLLNWLEGQTVLYEDFNY